MGFLESLLQQQKQAAAPAAAPAIPGIPAPAAGGGGGITGAVSDIATGAAVGGPVGAAVGLGKAILGGIAEAAQKKKEGELAGFAAQQAGANKMSEAQAAGLGNLMAAYRGVLG